MDSNKDGISKFVNDILALSCVRSLSRQMLGFSCKECYYHYVMSATGTASFNNNVINEGECLFGKTLLNHVVVTCILCTLRTKCISA